MIRIRLPHGEWEYDPDKPLGPKGGFGAVFAGRGDVGAVAIKRLHLTASEAAHRELRIADEFLDRSFKHVIPIYDAGQDAESEYYFVVMPQAEKSLQKEIDQFGPMNAERTIGILQDIVYGLLEVNELVHRDLKPGNVLYHEGKWKLADFGIARFVEESTSLNTLKGFLSPQYAAPEQWLLEHVSQATDVYALGCIAYALLTGSPPFVGPASEDFKEQHLQSPPPPLQVLPSLSTLVSMMLRKLPQSRPGLKRVSELLVKVGTDLSSFNSGIGGGGFTQLAQAGAKDADAALRAEAERVEQAAKLKARRELASSAFAFLRDIVQTLSQQILDAAPTAESSIGSNKFLSITLGSAIIEVEPIHTGPNPIPSNAFNRSGWDVIAGAIVRVRQYVSQKYEWSANLWYTNLGKQDYRWWEVCYWQYRSDKYKPFALAEYAEADLAASNSMASIGLATEPRTIDDEDVQDFCNRWAGLLAKAYNGKLSFPTFIPFDWKHILEA